MFQKKGKYKTRNGLVAIVAQIKDIDSKWFLVGVIKCGNTNILALHVWDLQGKSITSDNFNLTLGE